MKWLGRKRRAGTGGTTSDDNFDLAQDLRTISLTADSSAIETLNTLREFERQHALDPNLPLDELNDVDTVLATGDKEKGIEIEHTLVEENSPYPEVRLRI